MDGHTQRSEDGPIDRLTRLCDAMSVTLENHPEADGTERCIIFMDDGTHGGIVLHGYDNETDAMADLFVHIRAIFRAMGKDFQVHAIGEG